MSRFLLSFVLAATLLCIAADSADAGGRRPWGLRRYVPQRTPHNVQARYYPPSRAYYPNSYDAYQDLYPKFYGGFHSRYFTTYGYPSGDIGLRGLPW